MNSYNKLFIFFSFSLIASVYVFNVLRDAIMCLFLFFILTLLFINYYNYTKKIWTLLIISSLWFCIWIFIWEFHYKSILNNSDIIKSYDNTQEHKLHLEIKQIHKISDFDIEYKVKILSINKNMINTQLYWILKTKKNFDLQTGKIISVDSQIKEIKNFDNNFDYKSFMYSQWIYAIFYSHNFKNINSKKQNFVIEKLRVWRSVILKSIHELFPKKEAVFLWWILIWARENIPEDMKTSFNNSGLTHLIAVSWYNITIVIVFLSYVLLYFPKILKISVITMSIVWYTIIVWDSPAVIRAAIMWLVWYYVLLSWRKWDSLAIILLTWLLMLISNPFLLNYDISFQLSFLAVFWLLYTQWFFEKIFFFFPKKFAIQESFVLTLSAFVFTVPIMLHNFWQVSVLAPIANMLVAWTIPFAMLFGILSILFHILFPQIGFILWYWEYFLLKWTTSTAKYFWNLDFAILKIEFWNYWYYFHTLYFMIIIFCIFYFSKGEKNT